MNLKILRANINERQNIIKPSNMFLGRNNACMYLKNQWLCGKYSAALPIKARIQANSD